MNNFTKFSSHNLFSTLSRERCITNLNKIRIPLRENVPKAAVLVLMCGVEDNVSLFYSVRASQLRTHSGQIAFPGGKSDENETPVQTALRETEEEVGLTRKKVEVWGQGPAFPGRNNAINITPVIASLQDYKTDDICINPKEVSECFTVPLQTLCNPKNHHYTQFKNGYILPVFNVENHRIWGVTAYITHIFLNCLLSRDIYNNDWMSKKIVIKD